MTDASARADTSSLGYNPLTYADPTGEAVIRRLEGDVTITWPDGFTLRIEKIESGPLVTLLATVYQFTRSRRGNLVGKKKGPGNAAVTAPRPAIPTEA